MSMDFLLQGEILRKSDFCFTTQKMKWIDNSMGLTVLGTLIIYFSVIMLTVVNIA